MFISLAVAVWDSLVPEMQYQSYQGAEAALGVLDWVSRIRWTQPSDQCLQPTPAHPGCAVKASVAAGLCLSQFVTLSFLKSSRSRVTTWPACV